MFGNFVDRPANGSCQRVAKHATAGVADGGDESGGPSLYTVALHMRQQQAVRKEDEVGVPGLALAASQLTVSEPQMLLAVPMKGLRSGPTATIRADDALHFPVQLVCDKNFGCNGLMLTLDTVLSPGLEQFRRPPFPKETGSVWF